MAIVRGVSFVLLSLASFAQSNSMPSSTRPQPPSRSVSTLRRARVATPQGSSLSFAPVVSYSSGGIGTTSVAVGDINGDGKPDLIATNPCADSSCSNGVVAVLIGNGDGTFQAATTYNSGGIYPYSVALSDLNRDGKLDLIVANCAATGVCPSDGSTLGILLGNGDGTFQPAMTYNSGGYYAHSVTVGDLNGDGYPDLVVANTCPSEGTCANDSTVGVLLGNGDGTFQAALTYDSGGLEAESVTVIDVNHDGNADIIVANTCGNSNGCAPTASQGVLLGNGDGTFQLPVTYSSGGYFAQSLALADVNGDGNADGLLSNLYCTNNNCSSNNGTLGVLLGNSDGIFQAAATYDSGGVWAYSVGTGDVNGDGKIDALVANACGTGTCPSGDSTVGVLLGNGDGTFETAVTFDTGGYVANSVTTADVNGDGKPDAIVANECASTSNCTNGSLGVLINTSVGMTTNSLVSSPDPSNFGQNAVFSSTIRPQGFTSRPTGSVTFLDGTNVVGTGSLNESGVATLTTAALAVGTHSITATYNGDSNCAPSTSSVLSQLVQGATAQISPSSLNFGNQTVGIRSAGQAVTVNNPGNLALTLTVSITGSASADFSQASNCGSSVAPGGSCTVNVVFTPSVASVRTASLIFTDNAPNSPQSVPLTGSGVTPTVTLSPTSLNFPDQVVFTKSKAQSVTLTNTGLGILEIKGGGISGPFGITTNCAGSVSPGASCAINVTFKPTTIGPLTGAVSIRDNAPGSPQKIPLSGTGTYILLSPTNWNFGNQPVGTTSLQKNITLSNKGSVAVSITGITITGTNASDFAQVNNCGASVAAGASCLIGVTFTPSATGARSASISVSDNGGGSPQQALLVGTGTP